MKVYCTVTKNFNRAAITINVLFAKADQDLQ